MVKNGLKYAMISFLFFATSLKGAEMDLNSFLQKYPGPIYQDIVIGSEIHQIGTDQCEPRYQLIKPVFEQLNRPFSLLDLGAAQGYFSIRVANDFPHSSCVMIEANNTSYYARHGDMLYDICLMNSHLKNICYLDKRMDINDLIYLNNKEHFDVVIAFLVVHLMHETLKEQIKIIECLLNLGDNLILEVANDVGVVHTSYVEYLSQSLDCQYLGEVKRHKDPISQSTGKLFWFKRKTSSSTKEKEKSPYQRIKKETFNRLNGKYPDQFSFAN